MGTHRRYSIDTLRVYSNTKEFKTHENKTSQLRCAVYARVSAPKQKGDLARQIESVKETVKNSGLIPVKVYTDIASGVNDKRKGLKKMLDDVPKRLFDNVVVKYKDRLSRFGSNIIRQYLQSWGAELTIINSLGNKSIPETELITDLTAILYFFMGKLYRSRRKSKSKDTSLKIT